VQNRLADACAHEGGLGAGGRLLWKGASGSMGFLPSGFFSSPFPSSPSQPPNAHEQAGRKSMLKRI